jgi:predicted AlkP superfamily pyrophosphatase or phosphodiesterase
MRFFLLVCRAVFIAFIGCWLGSCAVPPSAPPHRPKLLVVLVVDGLPQRQVLAYRDQLGPDGLARFLERGTWFDQAFYRHAHTVTASGHAIVLTGAYPDRTGIIGNDWRDPKTGARVYNTSDPDARYIAHTTDAVDDGTSPKNLKAETLGDVLRRTDPRSKVIAVSGKDRGAILLAGKAGTAYMYMDESGLFATSTYYRPAHPAWVDDFNAAKPADRYFRAQWKPLLPPAAYARSLPDGQPGWAPGGTLPMAMRSAGEPAPGPAFYGRLLRSPFIDEMSLDFARAAIRGEQLGQDDSTDILAVSLSGHDYVNHQWSAESAVSQDHLLQLDRMLQSFFHDLDTLVGKNEYVAVLTADHGFMPTPEYAKSLGLDAGRIKFSSVIARLNAGVSARFGAGRWVIGNSASSLLLDKKLIGERGVDPDRVAEEVRRLLLGEPGIAAAYTRAELLAGTRRTEPLFEALRKSWHPEVSGEVQYTAKPNWMFGSSGATHGSPYAYDTHVPMLVYGPAWVKTGRVQTPVDPAGLAPALARLLGIAAPAQSEAPPLPLATDPPRQAQARIRPVNPQ